MTYSERDDVAYALQGLLRRWPVVNRGDTRTRINRDFVQLLVGLDRRGSAPHKSEKPKSN